jgi:hypothetical protein
MLRVVLTSVVVAVSVVAGRMLRLVLVTVFPSRVVVKRKVSVTVDAG